MRRTIEDAEADFQILLDETELLLERLEAATRPTEAAALEAEFNERMSDLEERREEIAAYYDRRDQRWARMLRRSYGYLPR